MAKCCVKIQKTGRQPETNIYVDSEDAAILMLEQIAHFDPFGVAGGMYTIGWQSPSGFYQSNNISV